MLSYTIQSCIDRARTFQKNLLKLFNCKRSYASLQLVEALAYAPKPTSVVELSEETPFQRSYSMINKVLNEFGEASLVAKQINEGETVKTVQTVDPAIFAKITKPFSTMFVKMLPKEVHRKFRLFVIDP